MIASAEWRFNFTATRDAVDGIQLQEVELFGFNQSEPLVIKQATNPGGNHISGGLESEGPSRVIDGNTGKSGSKWLDLGFAARGHSELVLELDVPMEVTSYRFWTAGHALGRNPESWTMWAHADGEWMLMDTQVGVESPANPFAPYGVNGQGFSLISPRGNSISWVYWTMTARSSECLAQRAMLPDSFANQQASLSSVRATVLVWWWERQRVFCEDWYFVASNAILTRE